MRLPLTIRWPALRIVLKDAWPAWLTIAGLVVAFALGSLMGGTKAESVLYAGTILQLLGLAIVAHGLSGMRRLFGRPSLLARIAAWFRALGAAFRPPKPQTLQVSAAGVAALAGSATLSRGSNPNATLEDRVSVLEADVAALRSAHEKVVQSVQQEVSQIREEGRRQVSELRGADEKTNKKIEEVAIGGLHLETAGLVWLLFGVIAGSVPDKVAAVFARLL